MKKLVLVPVVVVLAVALALPATATGAAPPAPGPASPGPARATAEEPASAAASTFAISVTEPGPFAPGETITVEVTGGHDGAIVVASQCDATGEACASASYLNLGSSGAGTIELGARRRVVGPGGVAVDCALEPCAITAYLYGATSVEASASAPIAIDPAAPLPRPSVRVVAAGPIQGTGPVTVEGSGYDPLDYLSFFECSWDPPSPYVPCAPVPGYATTDAAGNFSASVRLSRTLLGTDCAARPGRCQVWAVPYGNIDLIWGAPLTFDGANAPVVPQVSVDPTTDLVHRQTVSVTGSGFAPSSTVQVRQCTPLTGWNGGCPTLAYVPTNASGEFTSSVAVRRTRGDEDCAVVGCWIRVSGPPVDTVDVDLSFDPTAPLPPAPTLTVEPSTDLVDRQVVTATVTNLDASSYVSFSQCTIVEPVCRSTPVSYTIGPDGTAVVPITVFRSPAPGRDCVDDGCELSVGISDAGDYRVLTAPLQFDPSAPPPPPPDARVVPATGLWDRQRVSIRGERFDQWSSLQVRQCAGDPSVVANCTPVLWTSSGPDGDLDTPYTVRRVLALAGGPQDCLAVACVISIRGNQIAFDLPLAFDANGPLVGDDLPAQLECVSWPTEAWPTGPIPAGVDAAAVQAMGEDMVTNQGDSVVVIHGGRLVYENYGEGLDENAIFPSFSVSKSFTATMVGLLADDGLIDIDDTSLFPEWSGPGDPRSAISTRHILNMASGLSWNENYSDPNSDAIKLVQAQDAAAYVVAKPLQNTPGTSWQYSTGDTMLLSRIIGDAAGVSGPTYEALLHERLFDPLGINPVTPGFDEAGRWKAGWLTNTTTRNFAKLGLLYLRHGVWEDEQFLSKEWVDFVRAPSPASSGYGGQFWLNSDGSFEMVGVGGQTVLIVPQQDLIVAVNNGGDAGGMAQLFENAAPPSCGSSTAAAVVDDAATVDTDGSVLVDVLANDSGGTVGLAPETLTVATPPAHGTAVVEAGAVRYEPADGFVGDDSFTYVVCTANRRSCLEATVSVVVGAPLGAPTGGGRGGWLTVSAQS